MQHKPAQRAKGRGGHPASFWPSQQELVYLMADSTIRAGAFHLQAGCKCRVKLKEKYEAHVKARKDIQP